jgi:hypothetical protein
MLQIWSDRIDSRHSTLDQYVGHGKHRRRDIDIIKELYLHKTSLAEQMKLDDRKLEEGKGILNATT